MKIFLFFSLLIFIHPGCSKSIKQHQLFSDVQELSSDKYKGRKTGTAENKMAAAYIIKRFEEIGLQAFNNDYKKEFTFKNRAGETTDGANLIAYIRGKKEDAIVISAHYDHVGVIDGEIYNGADDNASGVGGLLAIAQFFSKNQPEHTLIFAAFDAEEAGLQGAKAFVGNPSVELSKIKFNINMDMISRSDKNELYAVGTFHYPLLKNYVVTGNPNIKILLGHDDPKLGRDDWTNQSDQGAFHAKNIPFLYFGVEDHADYHKPADDYSRINKEFYQNAVASILEVIQNIDKSITIQESLKNKKIMQ
ncbi:M28 family peptidase [Paradesertivirga mongoliensis]|uniref:M28 family peptidase n=1 Tax=Paradesertivirga mongoliensis TaxID=2100740 RepID=A0ABW4ZMJ9_9SPHI|nr:M28 family peptidase [Pedobacter mongoliensis]